MKGCQGREAYLERYLWGETTPEEVAGFESHAAGCASCKGAFTAAAAFDAAMKKAMPAWAASVSNPRELVLEQITVGDLMAPKPTTWKTVRWRAVRWVLLFGLVASVAVAFEGFATMAIARKKMLRDVTVVEVRSIGRFIERYGARENEFPGSGNENMVADLVMVWGRAHSPFDEERVVANRALDPWGEPYVYRRGEGSFILYSLGENGRDDQGQGDDIPYSTSSKGRGG